MRRGTSVVVRLDSIGINCQSRFGRAESRIVFATLAFQVWIHPAFNERGPRFGEAARSQSLVSGRRWD